jgi:DNA primase
MSYSENFKKVLSMVQIEDVVGHYIDLKAAGRSLTACCPFHQEKTPSFSVSPSKGVFSCFGCGATGDAINFVQRYENLPKAYLAMEKIASLFHIEIERGGNTPEGEHSNLYSCTKEYQKVFAAAVSTLPLEVKRAHLFDRGIRSKEILHKWGIGYCSGAKPSGFDAEATELGIINQNGNLSFYSRLTFPLLDHVGRIVGFAGKDYAGTSNAKYINSPESSIYKKSNFLYGMYYAAKEIKAQGAAIVVEGYYDCIAMHESGASNTVAVCGTALTSGQAAAIHRLAPKAILLLDADVWTDPKKLQKQYADILNLLNAGLDVTILRLPEADPGDLALNGLDFLGDCQAYDPISYCKNILNMPFQKVIEDMAKVSPMKIETLKREICLHYGQTIQMVSKILASKK